MYTVEIYKTDARTRAGERLKFKRDYDTTNRSTLEKSVKDTLGKGERYEIHETWVTRRVHESFGGREYEERYDTPISCSPASDTYWSM